MVLIVEELEVEFYEDTSGKCPFLEWQESLRDRRVEAKIDKRIQRIRTGNLGDCKRLKEADGIWELRMDFGPGYRLYYGRDGNKLIVLLCGGIKRTQDADIERAEKYWRDYQERK